MRRSRGAILILCLLLLVVMLTLGLGFLGKRVPQYRASARAAAVVQARALARMGLADFKAKIDRDRDFPPGSDEQTVFSYSESVQDLVTGQRVGQYRVTVDRRWSDPPYLIMVVSAVGTVGGADNPVAMEEVKAELDLAPLERGGTLANPGYYKWVNWAETSSF